MTPDVDVLIPTYRRPAAVAVTLSSLVWQTYRRMRVVVSDQTEDGDPCAAGEVVTVLRLLRARGRAVEVHKHLPRRGLAEHRQFLLGLARAPYALFLDNDVVLEPDLVERLVRMIGEQACGFVGSGLIGLSYLHDVRPQEQAIELWDGQVTPEQVMPGTPAWQRHRLHNAANLYHLAQRLGVTAANQLAYKVAWVGGCVLYATSALRSVGGFGFWPDLPPDHCGEDVLAQLRVMARFGGCGILPSGAYHQELPTTVPDRHCDAPLVLGVDPAAVGLRAALPNARHLAGRADPAVNMLGLAPGRGEVLAGVRKIAVLRANGIGDFILALPALEALRAAYPAAEIVLLGADWHADFLRGRPGPVDRVVSVPAAEGVRVDRPPEGRAVLDAFFTEMRRERFDLAVQLHGGGRHSNLFTARLGARLTVGSRAPDAPPLDRWVPYTGFQHEILRFLEVVALVGATPVTLAPRVAVLDADRQDSEGVLHTGGLDSRPDGPLVALHPGAGDPRRRWPPERFAQVGMALAARGARLVVIGTAPEKDLADAVVEGIQAAGGSAENLCGRLSLGGLAGLLERCRLLVSNDSGPIHLAAAVGTATVGVYWCGNLLTAGPLARSLQRALISWRMICPVCHRDCMRGDCAHEASFVADVPAGAVLDEALDLLVAVDR